MSGPVGHLVVPGAEGRIHLLDYGGRGPALVLLHGVTGSGWVWHSVAPQLAATHRVYAMDLRGHGESQWSPRHRYSTTDHAEDLAAVIDHVCPDAPAHLAGSSWGALIALAYTAAHPARVRSLALVDIEPSFDTSETDVPDRPDSFASHDEALAWERGANPGAAPAMLDLLALQHTRPGPGGRLHRKHDPYFLTRWPFRVDNHWTALADVAQPVLVVQAGRSFVRPAVTQQMTGTLPHGRRVEIPESGHAVPVDAPDALTKHLTAFLTDIGDDLPPPPS